jgi:hypothetical protein
MCPPPFFGSGGTHSLAGGGGPNSEEGTDTVVLCASAGMSTGTDLIAVQLDAGDMMFAEAAPKEDHLSVQDPPARGRNWIHSGHRHDFVFYNETEKEPQFIFADL